MSKAYYVLAGGYDTKNVGDYAMLSFLRRILDDRDYDLKILSRHRHEHLIYTYNASGLIDNFEYNSRVESQGKFFRGFNYGDTSDHLHSLRQELEGSAGLIIGGGRLLIDFSLDIMRGPLMYFATLVTLCRFLNIPVYIYAMTIIPNKTHEGEMWLKYIVDNAVRVSVRDEASVKCLKSVGCRQKNISVLPDPAYGLGWTKSHEVNFPKRAGLSVRLINDRWGGISEEEYLQKMASVIGLLQDRNIEVIGIPHQYYDVDNPNFDDRTIFKKINQVISFQYVDYEMLDIKEYEELYRSLGLLVGIRRHSFVFAALSGVPIIPFSENPNAARVCKELDTITPFPLDFDLNFFSRNLDIFLNNLTEHSFRQNMALAYASSKLQERYTNWLFGEM